ncbi:hypothetical protein SO802_019859, partial [Lithocarpus litseifolius]
MDEGEIPGSLWSSSSSPSHDNLHQSESWLNFLLLVQELQSSNSAAQDVDFEEEEEDAVTGTNSNSKLRSDSFMAFMAEQLPPLDSALEHEITNSKYAAVVDSSKVASCSNSSDLVPLPLNSESSFSVPLPMPPVDFVSERTSMPDLPCAALNQVDPPFNVVNNTQFQPPIANANGVASYYNFASEFVPLSLNSAVTGVVSSPLPMAPPHPHAVDFNAAANQRTYYKSMLDLPCAALNQVDPQFNVVNNTQFQPPIANANGVASYYNFASEFVPLSLNSAMTGVVSSPLPMAPPHPHAVDFKSKHAYYKSKPEISCAASNQANQQFNVVNNTQLQPPIANTNAKVITNFDEAKRQRRKQANLKSAKQSRKRRQDLMKNTEIEVEHLKKIASELSLACSERKENCDTSHCWNRVAIIDRVTIIARVYTSEKQLMSVTGFHPLDDPVFISIAENAGLNLSDVRSLIHSPTYLTSQIPPYLSQLVSTFSSALHPQEQQVQNQNFMNIGLHGAMLGWDNNQQKNSVALENPDFSTYPRAKCAMEHSHKIVLHASDALFIPEG